MEGHYRAERARGMEMAAVIASEIAAQDLATSERFAAESNSTNDWMAREYRAKAERGFLIAAAIRVKAKAEAG